MGRREGAAVPALASYKNARYRDWIVSVLGITVLSSGLKTPEVITCNSGNHGNIAR